MVSPCLAGASNGSRGTEGAKAADISKPWYLSIAGSSECLSKIWYLGFDPSVYKRRDDNLSACFFKNILCWFNGAARGEQRKKWGPPTWSAKRTSLTWRRTWRLGSGMGFLLYVNRSWWSNKKPSHLMQNGSAWHLPASGRWSASVCSFVHVWTQRVFSKHLRNTFGCQRFTARPKLLHTGVLAQVAGLVENSGDVLPLCQNLLADPFV